jgi:myo-inositol-1-phosphate synthase
MVAAGILASWRFMMGSMMKLGTDTATLRDDNIPFHEIQPMVHPQRFYHRRPHATNLAEEIDHAAALKPTLKSWVHNVTVSNG